MSTVFTRPPIPLDARRPEGAFPESPVGSARPEPPAGAVPPLIELVLKDPHGLTGLLRDRSRQADLVPSLLAISLAGFTAFGVTLAVVYSTVRVWPQFHPIADWLAGREKDLLRFVARPDGSALAPWRDGSALALVAAYDFGLIAAIGVCLPSFYFYTLLAGVRVSMLDVVVHALRGSTVTAVTLVGILPVYVAVILGSVALGAAGGMAQMPLVLGLAVPFIAGLQGVRSIHAGFMELADTLPADRRGARRLFLGRLIVAWSVCYTAVTPVMIHAFLASFSR